MDLSRMIAELQDERNRLDEAIEALERLSVGQTKRRGRPPRSLSADSGDSGNSDGAKPEPVLTRSRKSAADHA